MNKLDALRALEQKVAAGEWFPGLAQLSFGGVQNYYIALDAFNGSLDAAKALHEAVLPGWSVDDMSENGMLAGNPWGIRIEKWDGSRGGAVASTSGGWGRDDCPDDNPARAWLLAVIRALISIEEKKLAA